MRINAYAKICLSILSSENDRQAYGCGSAKIFLNNDNVLVHEKKSWEVTTTEEATLQSENNRVHRAPHVLQMWELFVRTEFNYFFHLMSCIMTVREWPRYLFEPPLQSYLKPHFHKLHQFHLNKRR